LTGAPAWTQEAGEEREGDKAEGAATQPAKPALYKMKRQELVEDYYRLMQRAGSRLTERARRAWRWRILWIRAALDAELLRTGGASSEQSEAYFEELTRIYRAENAEAHVAPPSTRALRRLYPPRRG
jgi:hypothetical protein